MQTTRILYEIYIPLHFNGEIYWKWTFQKA